LKYVITDLFETITLFNNSVKDLSYEKLSNGKYKVNITVNSLKYRADSLGKQVEVPIKDYIDIGVFAERTQDEKKIDHEIFMKKYLIKNKNEKIEIIVNE
jgi:ABC-2 type transport system permease protein